MPPVGLSLGKKRHKRQVHPEGSSVEQLPGILERVHESVARMAVTLASVFSSAAPVGGFTFSNSSERAAAIDWVWSLEYSDAQTEILDRNPELDELFSARVDKRVTPSRISDLEAFERRHRSRLNFSASLLGRNRNKDFIPKPMLLLALEAKHKRMNRTLWAEFSSVRVLPSYTWTEAFIAEALDCDPGCSYPIVDLVSAAVFDNYTEQMNYSAAHTVDTPGERIDMTNWATLYLPQSSLGAFTLQPAWNAPNSNRVLRSLFKPNFDKYCVIDLVHPHNPDLQANKHRRWNASFASLRAGTMFRRPGFQPAHAHELHYHPTMRGVLQSSYVDVEYEIDVMRGSPFHSHSWVCLVGGDGLAINRINHTLARKPGAYLNQTPAIIPVQGEHPHGTCHVLHMGWRPYAPLLVGILHAVGHNECKADFTVSNFNDYDHAMCILVEGIGKYFLHLESTPGCPPISNSTRFLLMCSRNPDLQWLSHFLHDYGFLYWDMRQAVRSNDSARIDLTWRECVSFMHSATAHKTQYAPMAILRIFWSEALTPALAQLYHTNRTVSLLGLRGSNVGWDMPIEKENLMISTNVTRPSYDRIDNYIAELNLLGPVSRGVERVLLSNRNRAPREMVRIDRDVQNVADYLKDTLGSTWAEACVQRSTRLVNPATSPRPWLEVEAQLADFGAWVRGHLDSKVTWM